jgi:hypothetical protein
MGCGGETKEAIPGNAILSFADWETAFSMAV